MSTESAPLIGIGESLRNRRRQKDLTLENVGQDTRISLRFLRALEDEKWEEFPAKVYLEGFLRQYANHLGLNGEELVVKLRETRTGQDKPPQLRRTTPQPAVSEGEDKGTNAKVIFFLGLVLVLGIVYLATHMEKSSFTEPSRPVVPSPAVGREEGSSAPVAPQEPHKLLVHAKEPVWMRVWVDQRVQFEGIFPRDGQRSWTGESSFRIQAGDFAVLEVSVNGAPLRPSHNKAGEVSWSASSAAPNAAPAAPAAPRASSPSQTFEARPAASSASEARPLRRIRPAAPAASGASAPGTGLQPQPSETPSASEEARPASRTSPAAPAQP